jgi:hypothetical protein
MYKEIGSDIEYKIKDYKYLIDTEKDLVYKTDFIDKLPVCNEILYKCG